MGRGRRVKVNNNKSFKHLIYLAGGIVLIMIITFIVTLIIYNNKLKNSNYSALTTEKISDLISDDENYLDDEINYIEEASVDIGKSIEETINNVEEASENINTNSSEENSVNNTQSTLDNYNEQTNTTNDVNADTVIVEDPEFIIPVEGEIMRGYAKDTLIYSETLEEWVTHLGIDIKADRTSIVKASEAGTVTAIKNDPRYGLTIVIEHVNGFKTVYSNLLTTEFISEGEIVEKGQSIGTVGNSASFEIVDEPHLHFEILKDNINIDPSIYIN